jgi:hypothetical protein
MPSVQIPLGSGEVIDDPGTLAPSSSYMLNHVTYTLTDDDSVPDGAVITDISMALRAMAVGSFGNFSVYGLPDGSVVTIPDTTSQQNGYGFNVYQTIDYDRFNFGFPHPILGSSFADAPQPGYPWTKAELFSREYGWVSIWKNINTVFSRNMEEYRVDLSSSYIEVTWTEVVALEIPGSVAFGDKVTVTAPRAVAFSVDGNTNVHDTEGVVKIFGDLEVTGDFGSGGDSLSAYLDSLGT